VSADRPGPDRLAKLLQVIECLRHLVGARRHGREALGQIHPADRAGGINQEFGGRATVTASVRPLVQEIVTPDEPRVRFGQEGISETQLLALPAIDLRRVNADGDHADAASVKSGSRC